MGEERNPLVTHGRGRGDQPMPALNEDCRLLVEQQFREGEFPEDEISVPASFARQLENVEREPGRRQEFGGGVS